MAALRETAAAAATGYSLVSWEGLTAEHRLVQVAELLGIEGDAPRAAGEEPQGWDVARVRRQTSGWPIRGGGSTASPPGRSGPGRWWR